MFTIQQIEAAHDKVKSGADFPEYIQEIKALGVTAFETWVIGSHTQYFGQDGYTTKSKPVYSDLQITDKSDARQFLEYLKMHQAGKTDYITFCSHCAETGIEKWYASLRDMTCTYYDKAGNIIHTEAIPG